jgi:hypothetical protein
MAAAASVVDEPGGAAAGPARAPWPVLLAALATTSIVVGAVWDISWHRTIGRDTFWTPAHLAIYLGALVAGLAGGAQVLRATWGSAPGTGVRVWGMRGPVGAWVAIWGAVAMLTAAPLDDWWHNAYGLDVEILSPPHTVIGLGMVAIQMGSLLVILAHQNRAGAGGRPTLAAAFAYGAGAALLMQATILTEWSLPNAQHRGTFYLIAAAMYPLPLVSVGRAGRLRWPATTAAAIYLALSLVMVWVLPLFPGRPLLGPILNPVDHMVPPPFPLLLVLPALAIDVLLRRVQGRDWTLALLLGAAFVAVFFVTQWWLAEFLLTPHARNWLFAADRWDYNVRVGEWRYEFWWIGQDPTTARSLGLAVLVAAVTSRIGLWYGSWMRSVVR